MTPLPRECSEEALRVWVNGVWLAAPHDAVWGTMARAVRALIEAKVREAITAARAQERRGGFTDDDEIIDSVLGAP